MVVRAEGEAAPAPAADAAAVAPPAPAVDEAAKKAAEVRTKEKGRERGVQGREVGYKSDESEAAEPAFHR